jgi:hypothetical protein
MGNLGNLDLEAPYAMELHRRRAKCLEGAGLQKLRGIDKSMLKIYSSPETKGYMLRWQCPEMEGETYLKDAGEMHGK